MQKNYSGLMRELVQIHRLNSEWDLVRWYYCSRINLEVIEERRKSIGDKVGDKYLLYPRLRKIEGCIKLCSLEEFFKQEVVTEERLSLKGFIDYLRELKQGHEKYQGKFSWLD